MDNQFIEIASLASLNDFVAGLNGAPGVLFKHSNSCGVSSRAYGEMSRLPHPVGLVVVQHARAVSDEIEKRWQVSHETPQVLIVRDGTVLWDASHFQIKAADVETALNKANGGEQ
jgi:bacillithiol system protein YtxJ